MSKQELDEVAKAIEIIAKASGADAYEVIETLYGPILTREEADLFLSILK